MIARQDILDRAGEWGLRPAIVEKDYVLGWLLVALARHPAVCAGWIFKGGTCLKKCYFETYRFSEDLDFTLVPSAEYDEGVIRRVLEEVARDAEELSGVDFPEELVVVERSHDKLGQLTFRARIAYRGPLGIPSPPRVLLDLTRYEPILDEPTPRSVLHPYPDGEAFPGDTQPRTYSLQELLAEKTRALLERTRPRDLYDVVYLLENPPNALDLDHTRELFRAKCKGKAIVPPTAIELVRLVTDSAELRADWEGMLAYQLPELPPIEGVLDRLPGLLGWIDEPVALPSVGLAPAPAPATEELVAPAGIRFWGGRVPLEVLRFAGGNRLVVEFTYDGKSRRVEPYSLRRASTGNLLLYGWEQGASSIKAFNTDKIEGLRATNLAFAPRYRVEFMASGPFVVPPTSVKARRGSVRAPRGVRRVQASSPHGPVYVFECSYCQKAFRHRKNDPTLRRHKMKSGFGDCPGRRGHLVRVE